MKKSTCLATLLLALSAPLAFAAPVHAHPTPPAETTPDTAWLAQAKADYPLKTCVVSEEEIGGPMGEGIDHVYKQDGKPDRLVRFCCKMCLPKFNKEPAKYLKLIDEAAAKAKKN